MDARDILSRSALPLLGKLKKSAGGDYFRFPFRERSMVAPKTRKVSIIIPAHNEERYIGETLDALRRQNYTSFEIIVVANGCTDQTVEVARDRCQRLVVLSEKSLGVSRNLGARMAQGEILVFLDADTTLEPMALRRIVEDFGEGAAAATLRGRPDQDRFAYRLIYGIKNSMHRFRLHSGSSGVIVCWKRHFEQVGGFNEKLELCENSELIERLKRFGSYKYIGDVSATTSMRRYDQRGVGNLAWMWLKVWVSSFFTDLHLRRYETVR